MNASNRNTQRALSTKLEWDFLCDWLKKKGQIHKKYYQKWGTSTILRGNAEDDEGMVPFIVHHCCFSEWVKATHTWWRVPDAAEERHRSDQRTDGRNIWRGEQVVNGNEEAKES